MGTQRVVRHEVVQPLDQSIKLIPLTKGQNAVVDAADYDWLMQWNWMALYVKSQNRYYACRGISISPWTIYMHRLLTGNLGNHTDHEDGNGLNNRRQNLRPCTVSQNHGNRKHPTKNHSGYKGVYWNRFSWCAGIHINNRHVHLGSYRTREEAAKAYDLAAKSHFGEFASLNFPT